MANPNCGANTEDTRQATLDRNLALIENINEAIDNLLGKPDDIDLRWKNSSNKVDKMAYDTYYDVRKKLGDHLFKNSKAIGQDFYDHKNYMLLIQDFVQKHVFVHGSAISLFRDANPRRMIAVGRLINGLMHLQNTRYGKKLNIWERAFLPTTLFAMRADPFGYIYRYATKATALLENSKRLSSPWKDGYNKIASKYAASVENILDLTDIVSPNMIFSNLTINSIDDIDESDPRYLAQGIQEVRTKNLRKVVYFGTIVKPDGRPVHLVINQKTGKKEEMPAHMISKGSIKKGMINKYVFELTNEIMLGQTRLINWRNVAGDDKKTAMAGASKEQLDAIHKILREKEFRRLDSEETLKKGMPSIHYTQYSGFKVMYAIIRDTVGPLNKETWSAFPIRVEGELFGTQNVFNGNKINPAFPSMEKLRGGELQQNRFNNGFYRSEKYDSFGPRYYEDTVSKQRDLSTSSIERGFNFSNIGTVYLNRQPNPLLLGSPRSTTTKVASDKRMEFGGLWETIQNTRTLYNGIAEDLSRKANEELVAVEKWLGANGLLTKMLSKNKDQAAVQETLNRIKELFNISNRIWVDKQGGIHTPNSHFVKINENYVPVQYENSVYEKMLEEAIGEMEARLVTMDNPKSDIYRNLDTKIKEFKLTRARLYSEENKDMAEEALKLEKELGIDKGSVSSGVIAQQSVHLKHRSQWTDLTRRRKGADVHSEYLDMVYTSITRNRLMTAMLETLYTMLKLNKDAFFNDTVDWLINRTKVSFGNPTAFGGIKGVMDYSNQRIADFLNKFSKEQKWDAYTVDKFLTWSKGFFGMGLLGASTGLTNRTQIVNGGIHFGWKSIMKSAYIVAGKDTTFTPEVVQAIIDNAGTDELANMLMDTLSHGTDIEWKDRGLLAIPGIPFQIPQPAFLDFMLMLKNNRAGFVKNGIPDHSANKVLTNALMDIDRKHRANILRRLELKETLIRSKLSNTDKLKYDAVMKTLAREEKRLSNSSQILNVRNLRELYMDLMMTEKKDNNRKYLEAKFKNIMGDVSDNRLKRMVAWKLSWWPEGFGPELFTMTESERIMRKQIVMTALLTNADMGTLGVVDWENDKSTITIKDKLGKVTMVDVPNAYLGTQAIRIARNAVSDTMFGMSMVNNGEAFVGAGQQAGLYKVYPLQQMIHDWNVFKAWYMGSGAKTSPKRFMDNMARITKEFGRATLRASTGQEYHVKDTEIDAEALAVIRLIVSRLAMTVTSVTMEMLGITRIFFRTPMAAAFSSMIRGGENPAFAIAFRIFINGMVAASMDDDDLFEGNMSEVGWDVMRLFLPVFFTLPLNMIAQWVDE